MRWLAKARFTGLFDRWNDERDIPVKGRDVRIAARYLLDYGKLLRQQGHEAAGLECNGLAVRLLEGE